MDFIEEHLQSTGAAGGVGLVTNEEYRQRRERVELTIAEEEEKLLQKAKSDMRNRRQRKEGERLPTGELADKKEK